MSDALLTTSDVAALMGVGATSVKRWADAGVLRCVKTAGGHRRFLRSEVDRFLRSQFPHSGSEDDTPDTDGWLRTLREAHDIYLVQSKLIELRARCGSWWRVAEELGGVLDRMGRAWREGEMSIIEEHVASELLHRSLAAAAANLPVSPDAPRCLLCVAPGDDHTLGLSLAELTAREAGWSTIWAGGRTPMDELARWAGSDRVDLVAVSASRWSADPEALNKTALALADACKAGNNRLVLGGTGAWPTDIPGAIRARTLEEFKNVLGR